MSIEGVLSWTGTIVLVVLAACLLSIAVPFTYKAIKAILG
jgi:hypothetical protein